MGTIENIIRDGKEIYVIDYSDCREEEMIALISELKTRIETGGRVVHVLSIFNDRCYATPKFMKYAEQNTSATFHLITKQAMTGLNDTKRLILKGYNFMFRKDIQAFDSREAAMKFLLDDTTSDSGRLWNR